MGRIAGIVANSSGRYIPRLEQMLEALHHRGPAGKGIRQFDNCILGRCSLWIEGPDEMSLPFLSQDSTIAVALDGSIFNKEEARNSFSHTFSSSSGEKTIAALMEADVLKANSLNGLFAFSLWDDKAQRLLLTRDHFGQKPLYYAVSSNNELVFASEITGILASGLIQPTLNPAAVAHYLQRLYVGQFSNTIYKEIKCLPPRLCPDLAKGGYISDPLSHPRQGNRP